MTLLLEEIFQKSERELKDVFCAQVTELNMIDWFIGMGDTSFFESIRYRYDTKDFQWYRYQISIPIPLNMNRLAKFYCETLSLTLPK